MFLQKASAAELLRFWGVLELMSVGEGVLQSCGLLLWSKGRAFDPRSLFMFRPGVGVSGLGRKVLLRVQTREVSTKKLFLQGCRGV